MPTTQIQLTKTNLLRRWASLTFGYFLLAGLMGAFLRLLFFQPITGINYRNFLHGHSHLAFLGWVFNALFVAFLYAYLPERTKKYRLLFILLQVSVIGMLISFPIQGYAAVSITFSTLHIFLSWWFAWQFWRDTKRKEIINQTHSSSLSFIRWSLVFMSLSAIGPFGLGVVMAKGLAGTPLYQLAIYFYLHFQYDGWFTFAVLGLFFWLLEKHHIAFNKQQVRYFLLLMAFSLFPAYALSALWTKPDAWVYVVATMAAILQLVALAFFIRTFLPIRRELKRLAGKFLYSLFFIAFLSFGLKIILQTLSALPAIADLAYLVRNFTIAYLHLVFLGFVSVFLLAWFAFHGFLDLKKGVSRVGIVLFLIGFVISQLYVVGQPLVATLGLEAIPFYYPTLFLFSLMMPVGLGVVLLNRRRVSKLTAIV